MPPPAAAIKERLPLQSGGMIFFGFFVDSGLPGVQTRRSDSKRLLNFSSKAHDFSRER
jgi:hypothetical protein